MVCDAYTSSAQNWPIVTWTHILLPKASFHKWHGDIFSTSLDLEIQHREGGSGELRIMWKPSVDSKVHAGFMAWLYLLKCK